MNPIRSFRPFAPLGLFLLAPILAGQAQEPAVPPAGDPLAPPVLNLSEIVLDQYPVQHVDASELFKLAREIVGRAYYIKEHGTGLISSMRLMGTKIVLYDTVEQVKRMREMLARLDVQREESKSDWKTVEYRPRFVSLTTVANAIGELVDFSPVPERGLVVLNYDSESVDGALALLKRIDIPEKQVLLTCQLIEVGGTSQGPPLPKDLVDNLLKLLPQSQFVQTGMAMLKTSVGGKDSISIRIENATDVYRLAFTPVAFDESSASLTVADCKLMQGVGEDERELFHTNTLLRGGEYTVLGATGATPKLLVLRVVPQG